MSEEITQIGFTRLLAGHLTKLPALRKVTLRTDEAILCQMKGGQTFLVLVTGPGEERKVENGSQKAEPAAAPANAAGAEKKRRAAA